MKMFLWRIILPRQLIVGINECALDERKDKARSGKREPDGRSHGSAALPAWPEGTIMKEGGKSSSSCSVPRPHGDMSMMTKLARFVFKFRRKEEVQTFQLPLILDLTVLPTPSGLLFSLIWCKLCTSEKQWLMQQRFEEICGLMKRKGSLILFAKKSTSFCITFCIFHFILGTDFQEPNSEEGDSREPGHTYPCRISEFPLVFNVPSWQLHGLIYARCRVEQKCVAINNWRGQE